MKKINIKKHIIFLLYITTLVLCFNLTISLKSITGNNFSYDQRRIYEIGFILITSLIILFSRNKQQSIVNMLLSFRYKIRISLLVIFLLAIITTLFKAKSEIIALSDISLFSLLFIITLFIADYFYKNPEVYIVLLVCFYLCVFIYSLNLFADYFWIISNNQITINKKIELLHNIHDGFLFQKTIFLDNIFSGIWCIYLIPCASKQGFNFAIKSISIISTTLIFYIAIIHSSILIPIEIAFVFSLCLIMYGTKSLRFIYSVLISIALAFILLNIMCYTYSIKTNLFIDINSLHSFNYLKAWNICINLAVNNPLLGIGMLNSPYYFLANNMNSIYPHSFLFTFLAENGVISTIIIFTVLFFSVGNLYKEQKKYHNPIKAVFFMALICIIINSMFSNSFIQPQSQFFYISIIAFCISMRRNIQIENNIKSIKFNNYYIHALRLFLFVTLIVFCMVILNQLHFIHTQYVIENNTNHDFSPSFWVYDWWLF